MAQSEPIEADRPDQTEGVNTVPKKWFQFEVGLNVEQIEKGEKQYLLPTLLSKYGLSNKVELRLITSLSRQVMQLIPTNLNSTGLQPIEVGTKVALWQEKKWRPQTSFLLQFLIPGTASKALDIQKIAPSFKISCQNSLTEKLAVGYNIGAEWNGFDNAPAYIYSLSPGVDFTKKWHGYLEIFGSVKNNEQPEHSIDGGFAYTVSNDCKVDISSGFGISPTASDWYVSIGVSARFNTQKRK